nr:hypothetical protein [Candidatus Sigynarchaeota archaeon]
MTKPTRPPLIVLALLLPLLVASPRVALNARVPSLAGENNTAITGAGTIHASSRGMIDDGTRD